VFERWSEGKIQRARAIFCTLDGCSCYAWSQSSGDSRGQSAAGYVWTDFSNEYSPLGDTTGNKFNHIFQTQT
jgi:hypothetical protein